MPRRRPADELRGRRVRVRAVLRAARRGRLGAAACVAALALAPPSAGAAALSRQSGRVWEPEVHLVAGQGTPPDRAGGYGAGAGLRLTITLGSFGVSSTVYDSIAIGVGLELMRHAGGGSPFGACVERTPAPAGTDVCTRVDAPGNPGGYVLFPVVARWSFAVTPTLSLFGEPGIGVFTSAGGAAAGPLLAFGGHLRLGDTTSAVLRLGWPVSTLGLAF
jgi:hypothetical protein